MSEEDRAAHEQFLSRGMAFTADALGDFLRIDAGKCTGCRTCARVCPAGCIAMDGEVAVRDAQAGKGCNACLACIHACPAHAISLPMGESNPAARFCNEHVKLSDLIAANETVR